MSDQFVLRWHYQEVTLLRNLSVFLESDVLTDVTISVESQNVKAHRLVLAMCSVYFLQLFQEMGDAQHPVIVLHNVALNDLKAVLAFIYRGQCIVSREQLPGLLAVAKMLKIQGLCDMKVPENNVQNDITSEKRPAEQETANKTDDNPIVYKEQTSSPIRNPLWDKPSEGFAENFLKNNDDNDDDDDNGYNLSTMMKKPPKDMSETCKCFLCGKYLSNQYNLRVHMETHEEAYHACQSCPHVSRSRDALRKHVSYRHPEEYHTRKRKKIT